MLNSKPLHLTAAAVS